MWEQFVRTIQLTHIRAEKDLEDTFSPPKKKEEKKAISSVTENHFSKTTKQGEHTPSA